MSEEDDDPNDESREEKTASWDDEDHIWRDFGTGSRSKKEDNYEREYRKHTDAQISEYASRAMSDSFKTCRTKFDEDDAPDDKRDLYKRLKKHNMGVREDGWRQYKEWKKTFRDAQHFASRVGLPDYQVKEVMMYTRQLDFQGGRRKEHLLLALISIVSDRYVQDLDNRVSDTTMFYVFMDSVNMDKGDLMKIRNNVRTQVNGLTATG